MPYGGQPVSPFARGLFNAMSIANMLLRARRDKELLDERKADRKRRQTSEEFATRTHLLESGARPLDAEGRFNAPGEITSMLEAGGQQVPLTRKFESRAPARPERTVEAPFGMGRFEIPTIEERFAQTLDQKRRQAEVEAGIRTEGRLAEILARRQGDMVALPGLEAPVHKSAVPYLTAKETAKATATRSAGDRASREKIAADNRASAERRTATTAGASRYSADKRTEAAAASRASRLSEQRDAKIQERVDAYQREEQGYHAEKIRIGEQLKAGSAGTETVTKGEAEKLHKRLFEIDLKIKNIQAKKADVLKKKPARSAPAPAGLDRATISLLKKHGIEVR